MANGDDIRTGPSGTQYKWDGQNWNPYVAPKPSKPTLMSDPQAFFTQRAGEMGQEAQRQMGMAFGPESQGKSIFSRLGHRMLSLAPETAGVVDKMIAGGMDWKNAIAMAGFATPATAPASGAYFATKGTAALTGLEPGVKAGDVSPENVQSALMAGSMVAGGAAARGTGPDLAKALERIKSGSHSDVLAELEDFRKTMRKKPSATQQDVARVKHKALSDRIDQEWNQIHSVMGNKPTDALAIQKGLSEVAKLDPTVQKWIETHIEPSASGASVTAPLWEEVKALDSQMGKALKNPNTPATIRAEIPAARQALDEAKRASAKEAGIELKYVRARQLTRNLENIKYHTGYKTTAVKPSPFYGIAGALAGLRGAMGLGATSEIGGAFMGKMLGSEAGKIATPSGKFTIPKESIEGEKAVWKQLGEEPPKNVGKTKIRLNIREAVKGKERTGGARAGDPAVLDTIQNDPQMQQLNAMMRARAEELARKYPVKPGSLGGAAKRLMKEEGGEFKVPGTGKAKFSVEEEAHLAKPGSKEYWSKNTKRDFPLGPTQMPHARISIEDFLRRLEGMNDPGEINKLRHLAGLDW